MIPPECEAALQLLDAFRRGELTASDLDALQLHLDGCQRCLTYQRYESALLERLVAAARNSCCPDELRATIYQMLARESRDN